MSLGNGRNITSSDVESFPLGTIPKSILERISQTYDDIMLDDVKNLIIRVIKDCEFQEFRSNFSIPTIDRISELPSEHYAFSEDERDFLINNHIKYRMCLAELEFDA